MLTKRSMVPAVLLFAILFPACSDTPSFPTFAQAPPAQVPPSPQPPTPDTEVLGRWSVTARLTAASGDKCIAEAVQSLIGAPKEYSITLTQTGSKVEVTVTANSGDYDCTFPNARADSAGFTTVGVGGFMKCRTSYAKKNFRCSDGTEANILPFGEDVSGSISGNELRGSWEMSWVDMMRQSADLETTTEFTGPRQ